MKANTVYCVQNHKRHFDIFEKLTAVPPIG